MTRRLVVVEVALVAATLFSGVLHASPATSLPGLPGLHLPGTPPKPPAVPAAGYGFTDGTAILGLSQAELDRELDAVAATSATWLRMPFNWSIVEPTRGVQRWTATDRVVASAQAHGLTVLGVISSAPAWARASADPTAPPADPATFATFASQVASRYAGSVSNFEIWNEPNIPDFWGGSPDVAAYTALLKAAYPAIKAVQPGATVVTAGLAGGGSRSISRPDFVTGMYTNGAAGYFDAVAVHPYLPATKNAAAATAFTKQLNSIRGAMSTHGDGAKKVWFTEFGSTTATGTYTPKQQSELALWQLGQAARNPGVGVCILYTIRDVGPDKSAPEQNFGELLTNDWQPKPLAAALADKTPPGIS